MDKGVKAMRRSRAPGPTGYNGQYSRRVYIATDFQWHFLLSPRCSRHERPVPLAQMMMSSVYKLGTSRLPAALFKGIAVEFTVAKNNIDVYIKFSIE